MKSLKKLKIITVLGFFGVLIHGLVLYFIYKVDYPDLFFKNFPFLTAESFLLTFTLYKMKEEKNKGKK